MQDAGIFLAAEPSAKKFVRGRFTSTGLTGRIFRRDAEAGARPRKSVDVGGRRTTASLQLSGTTHAEKERMLSERQVELRRDLPRQPCDAFASPGEGCRFSTTRLSRLPLIRGRGDPKFLGECSEERSAFREKWQVKRIMQVGIGASARRQVSDFLRADRKHTFFGRISRSVYTEVRFLRFVQGVFRAKFF